jgi:acetylornithine deacetylase/succinyl-diaminopimelate desuccinylase-like protein
LELDFSPFEPVIKTDIHQGAIFAVDRVMTKGQMYMHVKALEYGSINTLPCNVKFMIEGEEEIGSKV